MIVDGWISDLYCDFPGCRESWTGHHARSRGKANAEFRKRGWLIRNNQCFCPTHKQDALQALILPGKNAV